MINFLEIVSTVLLAAGVAFVPRRACWWLWLAGNSLGLVTHFAVGGGWFIVRDIVFLGLAAWGLLRN